jgi:hypothetical protein
MLRLFIVGLALSTTTPVWRDRINRIDSRSRLVPQVATSSTPYSFCDTALAAGNRVGTWGCVNGDMTSPTGDTLGWTKTAGATVTTGTTCASPSYVTLTHATPDYISTVNSVIDTLPSSWTFCVAYEQTTNDNAAAFMVGAYPCCGSYNLTTEQVHGGQMTFYGGGGPTGIYATTGQKVLACSHRAAGTSTAYFRIDGSTLAVPSFGGYSYSTIAGQKFIVGAESTNYALQGKVYGAFYTETELVQADLDALYTAVFTCP